MRNQAAVTASIRLTGSKIRSRAAATTTSRTAARSVQSTPTRNWARRLLSPPPCRLVACRDERGEGCEVANAGEHCDEQAARSLPPSWRCARWGGWLSGWPWRAPRYGVLQGWAVRVTGVAEGADNERERAERTGDHHGEHEERGDRHWAAGRSLAVDPVEWVLEHLADGDSDLRSGGTRKLFDRGVEPAEPLLSGDAARDQAVGVGVRAGQSGMDGEAVAGVDSPGCGDGVRRGRL